MLADQMGAFTPYDIGNGVLALLLAALFAFVAGLIGRASGEGAPKHLAALAAVVALAVLFVRASVPLSIALVGVALLVRAGSLVPREGAWRSSLPQLVAVVIGVGCGSGAALITLVLMVPVVLLLRWSSAADPS